MEMARLYDEDTLFEKKASALKLSPSNRAKVDSAEDEKLMAQLTETIERRNKAQRTSLDLSNLKIDDELEAEFDFDTLQKQHAMANANEVWRRDTLVHASLEDFEMLSIIGHGTFGKVYLVR